MGTLYLIRHGQASFGAADYDKLSPLGERQSVRLGAYLASRGLGFEAVLTGTLKRHAQTWAGIAHGAGLDLAPLRLPGLNEYDSEALLHSIAPEPGPRPPDAAGVRQHFQHLRKALLGWIDGTLTPVGMPTFIDFQSGIRAVLAGLQQEFGAQREARVLVVSSGGPIATAVSQVLAAPPTTLVELNLQIRNSAQSELVLTQQQLRLVSFNSVAHLDEDDAARRARWLTWV